MTGKRDAAVILTVALAVSAISYLVGWESGEATVPPAEVRVEAPAACLRALKVADRELALAADLALTMSQVTPLVQDAYEAGLAGEVDPESVARAEFVQERYTEIWGRLGVLPNTRAKIANECENATP